MNTFIKHTFSKPWYSQSEVCEVFSISETWLKTQMTLTRDKGNDLKELGHFVIDGKREACFFPQILMDWIVTNKIQSVAKYTYEVSEKQTLQNGLNNLTERATS
jgi:hypothetical protein|tara:strand:+ start:156 stop:467 length:312 start_codon:yes stop_codon:yes gene_type:complete